MHEGEVLKRIEAIRERLDDRRADRNRRFEKLWADMNKRFHTLTGPTSAWFNPFTFLAIPFPFVQ